MSVNIQRVDRASIPNIEDDKLLRHCLSLSVLSWAGSVDGDLACVWGLVPPTLLSNQAYLWLYTTTLVDKHQFLFIRHSQLVVEQMLEQYPTIVGQVLTDNVRAKRWLRWLGAEFDYPKGNKIPFVIRKKADG